MTKAEKKWREEHDPCEQLQIVARWCDYEDYSVFDDLKGMEGVIELFCFIQFDCDVEFVASVQALIEEDEDWELLEKALKWDKKHGTHFWYDPR